MSKRIWMALLCLGLVVVAAAFAACGDDDGGTRTPTATPTVNPDQQAVIDVMTKLGTSDGNNATQAEIDFYGAHITDAFVQAFGTESIDACLADTANCIGDPLTNLTIDPAMVKIDGDSATLIMVADQGSFGTNLIKDGGVWKADGLFVTDDKIAEGAKVVDVELKEFAFGADLETAAVKSGDFAIHAKNVGQQTHEVALVPLPAEGTIDELLQDPNFQPQPILIKFPYGPGKESDIALPAPLDPGRYAFVCFLPDTTDPERTPHAFKGMVHEFTVE